MMGLTVRFNHSEYPDNVLADSVTGILNRHNTLSMATAMASASYINTAHYGYNSKLDLFILTQPFTQHSRNVEQNPSVAVAIWNEPSVWGTDLQGLQLFGRCRRVTAEETPVAMHAFSLHIPAFGEAFKTPEELDKIDSKLYIIRIDHLKLLDEPRFGRRNYLTLDVLGKD